MASTSLSNTLIELDDIVENLLLLLSDKEKTVIKKRFNLKGVGRHTLESIGEEFSVTRERIRQIEKNALSKMRRNVFNTSLRHLHDYTLDLVGEKGGIVREKVLLNDISERIGAIKKPDRNSLHLAFVLHDALDCIGNTIDFHPYVKERGLPDFSLKYVSGKLINQLNKYGDIENLNKLHSDMKNVLDGVNFDRKRMKSLLEIDKRITILENDMIGLIEWRHICPRTLFDKILYILKNEKQPLHFMEISKKIEKEKFDNRPVNLQAVHNELIRNNHFVLIGRGIYALKEWGFETGTVSDVVQRILKDQKELSEDKIIEQVLKQRRVKKITIVLALKNAENIERIGRKRYRYKA